MIALDTNVLLRFFLRDDEEQGEAAEKLLLQLTLDEPGFVSREVLVELVWALEYTFRFGRERIASILDQLVHVAAVEIESARDVVEATGGYRRGGADFADRMIAAAARRAGAVPLYTFERKAARLPGVTLVEPR
ncbi:MAG: type II toxin-antitoxin system VapC family toxin [Holophagales bacterium]|nr:type II toxin-antitoxin system VapC family toxin [Holophagales bacterium]MYC08812.1 type II toxin-antitoxin system VapC family toxin [Holophagales bacterium]